MPGAWVPLALLALGALCAYSVAMKGLITEADETDPVLLSAVVFTLVGGAAAGAALATGAPLGALGSPGVAPMIALDVALYTLAPILYFRAMARLPVSQIAILHGSVGVFTLVGGALLGTEPLTGARVGGAALIVGAIALVQAPAQARASARHTGALLAACLLYAGAALVDQRLVSGRGLSPPLMLGVAFLLPGVALLVFTLAGARDRRAALTQVLRRRGVYANAAALSVAYLCVYRAYAAGGPAAGVTLILAAEAVIVVLLAALLLREREQLPRKVLAGLVVAVGVVLVG